MVQKGFNDVDKRFDKVEKDMAIIKGQLAGVVYKPDFDKLEMRVEYLENILALKKRSVYATKSSLKKWVLNYQAQVA